MPHAERTTVVVITHNYGRYLTTAVESAMTQTRRPRVLIMDDGSTDDTPAIVQALTRTHPDISACRSPQAQGLSTTRNAAARIVTTEFVMYLDADDWIDATFVERGEQWLAARPSVDVLTTDATIVRDGRAPSVFTARVPQSWTGLVQRNTIVQTSIIRRSMVEALGGYDLSLDFEDWDFWIRALKAGYVIDRLPGAHVFRREHGLNKSKTCDEAAATRDIRDRHPTPSIWRQLRDRWLSRV